MKKAVLVCVLSVIGFFAQSSSVDANCPSGDRGRCLWFVGDEIECRDISDKHTSIGITRNC